MKKIIYVMTSLSHKRCFESFKERKDCVQAVAGPNPIITQNIIPEDYRDFNIKKRYIYNNLKDLQKIVDDFGPDFYVQGSVPCYKGLKLPPKCKKIYVSHGLIGNHVIDVVKSSEVDSSVWRGFDLYCGAGPYFESWVKYASGVDGSKIISNVIPQFDIISNSSYYDLYKDRVLKNSGNPKAEKIILFAGFCCRERKDFKMHNEDYFKTAVELERIAAKHNWLVLVKPRQTYTKMMQFLSGKKWKDTYYTKYQQIQKSKYLKFITTTGHIYRYFFADIFVANGCSTIEAEACVVKKPLVLVRTHPNISKKSYDPFETLQSDAAYEVNNIVNLEYNLLDIVNNGNIKENQQKIFIKNIGVIKDSYNIIQEKILTM